MVASGGSLQDAKPVLQLGVNKPVPWSSFFIFRCALDCIGQALSTPWLVYPCLGVLQSVARQPVSLPCPTDHDGGGMDGH